MAAELYIGLMSGTSLDGVDAALVEIDQQGVRCLGSSYLPYPDALRSAALALHQPGTDDLHHACLFANQLTALYGETVAALLDEVGTEARHIKAIGAHGQTVRHNPAAGYTLQLINPALLAELTGISVIADFRSRDIAAGGQGAPLVPAFHDASLRHGHEHRVILNIGGIANVTDLAPGRPTRGFDTGPGNMLLDAWISKHLGKAYDKDGNWAASGRVNEALLARLLQHPYLQTLPPKSCGREEFNLAWLENMLDGSEAPADVQASLLELTSSSISAAIHRHCGEPDRVLVCGGGARNSILMRSLTVQIPRSKVETTDIYGLPGDWLEAIAFAWLAQRSLHHLNGNLPEVTGACGPRILGAIYPR